MIPFTGKVWRLPCVFPEKGLLFFRFFGRIDILSFYSTKYREAVE
jgi:hypothetical protein